MSPILETETRRRYQREWIAKRRAEFYADKTCIDCGTTKHLELDGRDSSEQVNHRVWSWSIARREAELAKYHIRCSSCRRTRLADHQMRHRTRSRSPQRALPRAARDKIAAKRHARPSKPRTAVPRPGSSASTTPPTSPERDRGVPRSA